MAAYPGFPMFARALTACLLLFPVYAVAAEAFPADWRLVDISGAAIQQPRTSLYDNDDYVYRFLKSYACGLDYSDERFNGKATAYIVSDLSAWLPGFLNELNLEPRMGSKKDELHFFWGILSRASKEKIPQGMQAALVQTLEPGRLRNKIVHISFFAKTKTYRCDDVFQQYAAKLQDSKLDEDKLQAIRDTICGRFPEEDFRADMQVHVHTKDSFLSYETTGIPEKEQSDWQRFTSMVNVPEDATALTLGVSISGLGKIWADEFVVLAKGPANPEYASRYEEYRKSSLADEKFRYDKLRNLSWGGRRASAEDALTLLLIDSIVTQDAFKLPWLANENFEIAR